MTGHHKLGSLKQIYSLAVLETRSSKSRHQLTHVPLRALGKSTFMANPSSADPRLPLGLWPHRSARLPSPHGSPCYVSAPPTFLCLALTETHVTGFKAHIKSKQSFLGHLISSHLQRSPLWVKPHSRVLDTCPQGPLIDSLILLVDLHL